MRHFEELDPLRIGDGLTDEERMVRDTVAGRAIGCFGLTEPDLGSNPGGVRTRTRRDGGSRVLEGEKAWVTNGSIADVGVVWARTEDGIRGFAVEHDREGFSAVEHRGTYPLRASVSSQLVLQEGRVPEANRLPGTTGVMTRCPV